MVVQLHRYFELVEIIVHHITFDFDSISRCCCCCFNVNSTKGWVWGVTYCVVPLSWATGRWLIFSAIINCSVVFLSSKPPDQWLEEIALVRPRTLIMMPSILSKYRSQYIIEVERDAASPLAVPPEGIIPASLGVCVLIVSFVIISMISIFFNEMWVDFVQLLSVSSRAWLSSAKTDRG